MWQVLVEWAPGVADEKKKEHITKVKPKVDSDYVGRPNQLEPENSVTSFI